MMRRGDLPQILESSSLRGLTVSSNLPVAWLHGTNGVDGGTHQLREAYAFKTETKHKPWT